jgi:hypothetical protein
MTKSAAQAGIELTADIMQKRIDQLEAVLAMALDETAIPQHFPNWAAYAREALGRDKGYD